MLRVLNIIGGTSVDGPGLRTSVYMAGCHHKCPGCHNPQSWPMDGGREMSVEQIMEVVRENGFNVTLSGGDPFYQPMDELVRLARAVKSEGLTLWVYTGFTYEEIAGSAELSRLLPYIDVLVDGPFVEALRDLSLHFRGSSNQRLIDVPRSTPGKAVIINQQ